MRGAHELVQSMAHQDALDLDEPGNDSEFHQGLSLVFWRAIGLFEQSRAGFEPVEIFA
jgi:hypothetical protein